MNTVMNDRQKILIVDDTPTNIQILNDILQEDYAVFFATNGPDAIRVAHREMPDIILLDIMMPDMDGYAVCVALKSDPRTHQIPVIFITAMTEEEDEAKGLECGAIDYLTKPISPPIVRARVRNHLELKRHRDALEDLSMELANKNCQLENERALAYKVLENILPQDFQLPGFTTAVVFRPSDQIGGDFFDAWTDDSFTHFLVGDISGHSTSAALMMAVSKGIFRSLGQTVTEPVELVRAANRMLCPMMLDSQMFLTLVYALFDRCDNAITIVSAGHNPVYHLDAGKVTAVGSTGPVIGWDEADTWGSYRFRFEPGMTLFLYTDGLSEVKNAAGVEYGEKLPEALEQPCSPQVLADMVVAAAETFGDGFTDDVTVFVVERGEE